MRSASSSRAGSTRTTARSPPIRACSSSCARVRAYQRKLDELEHHRPRARTRSVEARGRGCAWYATSCSSRSGCRSRSPARRCTCRRSLFARVSRAPRLTPRKDVDRDDEAADRHAARPARRTRSRSAWCGGSAALAGRCSPRSCCRCRAGPRCACSIALRLVRRGLGVLFRRLRFRREVAALRAEREQLAPT